MLDVRIMFDLFKEKCPASKVSYKYYSVCCRKNFNFALPQVDTCVTCEELSVKSMNDTAKRVTVKIYTTELIVHKHRTKKFFSEMKETENLFKTDDSLLGLCFHFMQNLPIPKIPAQDVFYLRQLWLNLFCI